jgi:hypothetical protein
MAQLQVKKTILMKKKFKYSIKNLKHLVLLCFPFIDNQNQAILVVTKILISDRLFAGVI